MHRRHLLDAFKCVQFKYPYDDQKKYENRRLKVHQLTSEPNTGAVFQKQKKNMELNIFKNFCFI